ARGRGPERQGPERQGQGRDRRGSFEPRGGSGRGTFRQGGGAERFGRRTHQSLGFNDFEDDGAPTVEGILHVHRDGFGFVHPVSGEGENIFLPPGEAQRALDNDRVVVRVSGRPGRYEGVLLRVVTRSASWRWARTRIRAATRWCCPRTRACRAPSACPSPRWPRRATW
ncbi:hypothetical protein ACLESO_54740, partial [Pyxidicoccus sp. 3LG]